MVTRQTPGIAGGFWQMRPAGSTVLQCGRERPRSQRLLPTLLRFDPRHLHRTHVFFLLSQQHRGKFRCAAAHRVKPCGAPLYGTCVMFTPAMLLKSSIAR